LGTGQVVSLHASTRFIAAVEGDGLTRSTTDKTATPARGRRARRSTDCADQRFWCRPASAPELLDHRARSRGFSAA